MRIVIQDIEGGDRMYERMLTAYYDEIFRYCYHHVGSRETAEDLCQDTFVSFLEHKSDYHSRGKLKNYLYTIARNKCIDYHRKNRAGLYGNIAGNHGRQPV